MPQDYRGFIWYQWFRQNLTQMGTLCAVLLGCGGLLAGSSKGAAAVHACPSRVTRKELLGARTGRARRSASRS